jgi:hypothetical protein
MALLFFAPELFGVLLAPVMLLSGMAQDFILLWG